MSVGVGKVETQVARIALPPEGFALERGGVLRELEIAYETYGDLAEDRRNVIFICTALSGDAHAAGYHTDPEKDPGWWDAMIGPGRGIDTRYYHVVCANILGGCKGTTGPRSIDPATGRPYGANFPEMTVADIVETHCLLLGHLGITHLAAIVGGSFGGMQVLEWAVRRPAMMDRCVCIATAASLSTQALAFDSVARNMITSDPDWCEGDYYDKGAGPVKGLAQARQLGHITYLSQDIMKSRFGRERRSENGEEADGLGAFPEFQVSSYLAYQGMKFVNRFDANSYLRIMRAMDDFDLNTRSPGGLEETFAPLSAKMLVVAVSSDWLFPPEQSKEIANALLRAGKAVSYCQIEAPHGHDAFLVDIDNLVSVVHAFLPWVGDGKASGVAETGEAAAPPPSLSTGLEVKFATGAEREVIADMIAPGARVLDIGCGHGDLLALLDERRGATGIGVDIDLQQVVQVLNRGYDIFQEDIDGGLAMIPDGAYDCAILSETLQVVQRPRVVLNELLRVAREGIVSFPNFGNYGLIWQLLRSGRMPVGKALPFQWYNTPNIHLFTLHDFEMLCREDSIRILETVCLSDARIGKTLLSLGLRNLGADRVLVRVSR
jgi:homoserine O-acetyltransferase